MHNRRLKSEIYNRFDFAFFLSSLVLSFFLLSLFGSLQLLVCLFVWLFSCLYVRLPVCRFAIFYFLFFVLLCLLVNSFTCLSFVFDPQLPTQTEKPNKIITCVLLPRSQFTPQTGDEADTERIRYL